MIATLSSTPDGASGVAKELYNKIRKELLSHAHAEQETVYRRLMENAEEKDPVREAIKEHETIENILSDMDNLDPGTDAWKQMVERLESEVKHHVDEEESTLFDHMKRLFTDEESENISEQFLEKKNEKLEMMKD